LLLKRSILTQKIARRGHHITREYVVDPFETVRVADIMAHPAEALPADWTAGETLTFFTAADAPPRHKSYPVTDVGGRVLGMVSRADALRWLRDEQSPSTALREQITAQDLVIGYDDELAGQLADRMTSTDVGRVPIVRRKSGSLVGLVAPDAICCGSELTWCDMSASAKRSFACCHAPRRQGSRPGLEDRASCSQPPGRSMPRWTATRRVRRSMERRAAAFAMCLHHSGSRCGV
jgi:CBS domain-containing protein